MRIWAGFVLVFAFVCALGGCSSSGPVDAPSVGPEVEAGVSNKNLADMVVSREKPSRLRLPSGTAFLHLGDAPLEVIERSSRPVKSYAISSLPNGFPSTYAARGWENASQGFGVISTRGQAELIMQQYEEVDSEDYDEIVRRVKDANSGFEFEVVPRGDIEYLRTRDGRDCLVVSRLVVKKDKFQVSVSLGHNLLLTQIGMDIPPLPGAKAPEPVTTSAPAANVPVESEKNLEPVNVP